VLLAVARGGSLNEAAAMLGINQTTVSRRLDQLEAQTGCRLVERDRTGARLTPSGEEAVLLIEQMEGVALDLERSLLGGDARLSGTLRVTTTDTIAFYEPRLFTSFGERYPDVELIVGTGYAEQSLAKRAADVALRWTNRPGEHLFGRKMTRVEYALFGAKRLAKKVGSRDLGKYPWVAWDPGSGARLTEKWMAENVPEARIVCRYDSAISMHAAVLAGAGLAFIPCAFADLKD